MMEGKTPHTSNVCGCQPQESIFNTRLLVKSQQEISLCEAGTHLPYGPIYTRKFICCWKQFSSCRSLWTSTEVRLKFSRRPDWNTLGKFSQPSYTGEVFLTIWTHFQTSLAKVIVKTVGSCIVGLDSSSQGLFHWTGFEAAFSRFWNKKISQCRKGQKVKGWMDSTTESKQNQDSISLTQQYWK